MSVTHLTPVYPTQQHEQLTSEHRMRTITREVAFGAKWNAERRTEVAALFDSLAPGWTARLDSPERYLPITDALERCDATVTRHRESRVVELGSGTGLGTRRLHEHFDHVAAIDLSTEMLANASTPLLEGRDLSSTRTSLVQGDSVALPIRTGSVDVLVLVNMLLFPDEVNRVVSPDGVVIWVNTSAENTPIHLTPEEVVVALDSASPPSVNWTAQASRAGAGLWSATTRTTAGT